MDVYKLKTGQCTYKQNKWAYSNVGQTVNQSIWGELLNGKPVPHCMESCCWLQLFLLSPQGCPATSGIPFILVSGFAWTFTNDICVCVPFSVLFNVRIIPIHRKIWKHYNFFFIFISWNNLNVTRALSSFEKKPYLSRSQLWGDKEQWGVCFILLCLSYSIS